MNSTRPLVIAVGLILSGQLAFAQDVSRYRAYALESSLESVIAASGARAADAKTLYERPATIQELEWRAPYVDSRNTLADPVRDLSFTFCNDAMYEVIVNYDRDRTDGLANSDIVESLSAVYAAPTLASARTQTSPAVEAFPDSIVVARWENADSLVTLMLGRLRLNFS
jgi:hypothetical protein